MEPVPTSGRAPGFGGYMGMIHLNEEDAELILNALLRLRTDYELDLQDGRITSADYQTRVRQLIARAERLCRVLEDHHVRSV